MFELSNLEFNIVTRITPEEFRNKRREKRNDTSEFRSQHFSH